MKPKKPRPNLFNDATNELSQDAMPCWLARWADPDIAEYDPHLHLLGQSFLNQLGAGESPKSITKIEIKRQYKRIDILIVPNVAFAIAVEDKVGSTEHSDQLRRYRDVLRGEGYADIRLVYVQTGDQGSYTSAAEAEYRIIQRHQILELLQE